MKKIKKNIFGIGLALAIIMGIGLSFVPQSVNAEAGIGGNKVTCWSAGHYTGEDRYIDCSDCQPVEEYIHQGPSSKCKPSQNQ